MDRTSLEVWCLVAGHLVAYVERGLELGLGLAFGNTRAHMHHTHTHQ